MRKNIHILFNIVMESSKGNGDPKKMLGPKSYMPFFKKRKRKRKYGDVIRQKGLH